MPKQDGTGPNGAGPMTGRALGKCNGSKNNQGITNCKPCGKNLGRGRGRRGFNSQAN